MSVFDMILKLDGQPRAAAILLTVASGLWLLSMLAAMLPSKGTKGVRRSEIAVIALSICLTGSLTWVQHAFAEPEPAPAAAAALATGGGTGTCASVRPGMKVSQVKTLLGTPSIDESAEDARGPGARVMAFEESRCVVHLLNGSVDFVD